MKGSKELLEYYNTRMEALGEKATNLNMFLEGAALSYNDTKDHAINIASKWLYNNPKESYESQYDYCNRFKNEIKDKL